MLIVGFTSCGASKQIKNANGATSAYKPLKKRELREKYASLLDVKPKEIKNTRLYYFIDEWYGAKYKWGGNEKSGIDCSGLVCKIYQDVYGLKIQRTVTALHEEHKNFRKQRRFDEGDLVYFKTETKEPTHVGIYLQNGRFVHASKSKGVTIGILDEPYWKKTYLGGGKVKGHKS